MSERLPLTDNIRIKNRDNKLWDRDKKRARLYGFRKLSCPCSLHNGTGIAIRIEEIGKHLLRYGRAADCRTWRGPEDPDSSDEEWEADFTARNKAAARREQPRDSGVAVRDMVREIYQQVQEFAETEERVNEITMTALEDVDNITGINSDSVPMAHVPPCNDEGGSSEQHQPDTEEFRGQHGSQAPHVEGNCTSGHGNAELPPYITVDPDGQAPDVGVILDSGKLEEERIKDAQTLEEAMRSLFDGSKHSKLGATVMVVNLVATHPGITEKAADDILATFRCLMPEDNCLPGSLYQVINIFITVLV